jgi:opacity protein-like surface antigen
MSTGFDTSNSLFEINVPNPPVDPALTQVMPSGDWGPVGGSVLGPSAVGAGLSTAQVGVRSDLDAELVDVGIGGRVGVSMGRVELSVSTGPTLTVVDLDSCLRQTVQTGNAVASRRDSDSERDVKVGWSARCAVDVAVTARVNVGVGVRYDYVSGTVSTRHAELDPSGFGVDARLAVSF